MKRYRFIVARDQQKLYDYLVRSLASLPEIEVIQDRRVSERRHTPGPAPRVERRRAERRLGTGTRLHEALRAFGWAFMRA